MTETNDRRLDEPFDILAPLKAICKRLYDPTTLGAEFSPKQDPGEARLDLAKRLDCCIRELEGCISYDKTSRG